MLDSRAEAREGFMIHCQIPSKYVSIVYVSKCLILLAWDLVQYDHAVARAS
jgi:hypothetical protein